jgi:hypothetical protein
LIGFSIGASLSGVSMIEGKKTLKEDARKETKSQAKSI